jgi:hypothetical protein
MIVVEIKFTNGVIEKYITTYNGLFFLVWIMNNSNMVSQIRVEGHISRDYGYGEIEKWVENFTWDDDLP